MAVNVYFVFLAVIRKQLIHFEIHFMAVKSEQCISKVILTEETFENETSLMGKSRWIADLFIDGEKVQLQNCYSDMKAR